MSYPLYLLISIEIKYIHLGWKIAILTIKDCSIDIYSISAWLQSVSNRSFIDVMDTTEDRSSGDHPRPETARLSLRFIFTGDKTGCRNWSSKVGYKHSARTKRVAGGKKSRRFYVKTGFCRECVLCVPSVSSTAIVSSAHQFLLELLNLFPVFCVILILSFFVFQVISVLTSLK